VGSKAGVDVWVREKSCPSPGIHILDHLAHNLFAIMTVLL